MQYRPEIDGLRAIAVMAVILFHAGFSAFGGGYVGVDVFFVISGYLITTIILGELNEERFSLVTFYERRARRILPALFLVLLACLPAAYLLLVPSDMLSFSKSLVSISGFVSNLFFWSERGYFGTATELKPLIHTWSLAIEEQYYLIFPLILIALRRLRWPLVPLLLFMGVISLGLCVWLTIIHADTAFYMLPTRFWELLVGSLTAIYVLKGSTQKPRTKAMLETVGLAMIIVAIFAFDDRTWFPGMAALVPTLGAAFIIIGAQSVSPVGRILSWKPIVWLGLISYSAYLWHQPLFAFARHALPEGVSAFVYAGLIVLTLGLAFLSWKFVEQPFRNKSLWSRNAIFALAVIGLIVIACIGVYGARTDGMMQRYDAGQQTLLRQFLDTGNYTKARFDALKGAAFDDTSSKPKVLIIGDSYGKDLVNALYESGMAETLQLSTHQINSECGNLYVTEDFSAFVEKRRFWRCQLRGWYDNATMRARLAQADQIWLASAWEEWVAARLPESLANLRRDFKKPVLVFGAKNFGAVNQRTLLALTDAEKETYSLPTTPQHQQVVALMRTTLPQDAYIDVSQMLCGGEASCPAFTPAGDPISYDGSHLTKAGAAYYGHKLRDVSQLQAILH